jgi:hypothetical protein
MQAFVVEPFVAAFTVDLLHIIKEGILYVHIFRKLYNL